MTFALDDGKSAEGPLAVFDSEFALLEQRLTARLVERLQQERDPARRDLVYGFPQQFAALRECLGEFLNGVFKPNPTRNARCCAACTSPAEPRKAVRSTA